MDFQQIDLEEQDKMASRASHQQQVGLQTLVEPETSASISEDSECSEHMLESYWFYLLAGKKSSQRVYGQNQHPYGTLKSHILILIKTIKKFLQLHVPRLTLCQGLSYNAKFYWGEQNRWSIIYQDALSIHRQDRVLPTEI